MRRLNQIFDFEPVTDQYNGILYGFFTVLQGCAYVIFIPTSKTSPQMARVWLASQDETEYATDPHKFTPTKNVAKFRTNGEEK